MTTSGLTDLRRGSVLLTGAPGWQDASHARACALAALLWEKVRRDYLRVQLSAIWARTALAAGESEGYLYERLPERAVAVFGVVKSGGSYVPLKPELLGVIPSEPWVGGAAFARCYLSRLDLMAERFVSAAPLAHRTRDRVRWLPMDEREFVGRIDGEVKLRGFRFESGETEAVLLSHPEVCEVDVALFPVSSADRRLVAWIAGEASEAKLLALHHHMLPDYMVPSVLVALPFTPNGKVDRRRLPEPAFWQAGGRIVEAPRTPLKEVLCGLWAEVVNRRDDFFELSGHSLLTTSVRSTLGRELPLRELFEARTVAGLAAWTESSRRSPLLSAAPPILPRPADEPAVPSFAQEQLWFLGQLGPGSVVYNIPIPAALRLRGEFGVLALFAALGARRPAPLAEPAVRYSNFARWQSEWWLSGPVLADLLVFWKGRQPLLQLPTDHPRPAVQSFRRAREQAVLSADLAAAAVELGRGAAATPYMVLLAAFAARRARWAGQDELVLRMPMANRTQPETGLIGFFFVNTLVLPFDRSGDLEFRRLLAGVRGELLDASTHQDLPFEKLMEELSPERGIGHSPLFQVLFAFQNLPREAPGLPSLELEIVEIYNGTAKFDLTLALREEGGALAGTLEYTADLFDAVTVRRMLGHLQVPLPSAVADPGLRVSVLPLLTEEERSQLLVDFNRVPAVEPLGRGLPELFEAQARLAPGAAAVVSDYGSLTYAELDRLADRMAAGLRRPGVGPEERVVVCLGRRPETVGVLLAVLKAGGACVPLDPTYPRDRIARMVEDSGARLVLTEERWLDLLPEIGERALCLDRDRELLEADGMPAVPVDPDRLAYVIYTSGSTGAPKGVGVEHRSALAMVQALTVFKMDELAVVPSAIAELAREWQIPVGVRTVNLAGEALSGALVEEVHRAAPSARVLNVYGPSEDTTYLIWTVVEPGTASPMIGRPITSTWAYVLDRGSELLPLGVPGELYLAGDGLARGYLGRPDLTAERFVPDPCDEGGRLYRTGELVRRRSDGDLDFLGRIDQQVKVRGFRIELGEIEAPLVRQPRVRDAVVAARGEGESRRLVAWVVGETEGLRDSLRRELPEFMVPVAFVRMEALALSPNGKVDRKALPSSEPLQATGPETPARPLQELLAEGFTEVLGLEQVGLRNDFFDLGGHSLLATRVASRVERLLGVDLPVSALFREPTVAGLAKRIAGAIPAGPPLQRVGRDGSPLPPSFAQRRIWFFDQLQPGAAAYNLPCAVHLAGPLDVSTLGASLAEVVRRHEALRTAYPVLAGKPVQAVVPAGVELSRINLGGLPDPWTEAERLTHEEARNPFDLVRGPVCRTKLVRLGGDEHLLLVTLHHIAADGGSLGIFLRELASRYEGSALPDLPVQYADYAVWQRGWMQGKALEAQLAYWRGRLAGLPVLDLPTDRPRSGIRDLRGGTRFRTLEAGLLEDVARLARREGATLFMTLLAAQALLTRYTGEDAMPVGSPVARRVEIEPLIGCFVNTLVLDAQAGDDPGFRDLLARSREACLGVYAHQDIPFERLVEELQLQPHRELSQNPLFQVMFILEEPLPRQRAGGLSLVPRRIENGTAKFDLLLAKTPLSDGGWQASAQHSAALFDPATMDRLLGHWHTLLAGIVADPGVRLSALPLLTARESVQLLRSWSNTGSGPERGLRLHDLVAAQAERTPDAEAVVGEDVRFTYRDLMHRARHIVVRLRALGVGPETRVGLCVRRSAEMVPAVLGVLLTERELAPRLAFFSSEAVFLEEIEDGEAELGPQASADNLAYLIYTSGSTGRPKGVAIKHRSAVALVQWATYSTFARIPRRAAGASPIGRPLDGTQVRVVGRWWEPLPVGVLGELLLGGAGLAWWGSLGRPELTGKRFVPDLFGPSGERLYRSARLSCGRPNDVDSVPSPHPVATWEMSHLEGWCQPQAETSKEACTPADRQRLREADNSAPELVESPMMHFAPVASRQNVNVEPPKVFFHGLLSTQENSRWVGWLQRVAGRLSTRFRAGRPESLRPLTMTLDFSGSLPQSRELSLHFRQSHARSGVDKGSHLAKMLGSLELSANAGSNWESLFESLYGDSLPSSTNERPDLWGERLTRCLMAPAGRLPALRQFDRSRMAEILAGLPGCSEENRVPKTSWIEAIASSCERHWSEEEEKPQHMVRKASWGPAERCGFFLNRALSYPDQAIEEHREGLSQLGGLTRALSFAWLLLYRSLSVLPEEWNFSIRRSRAANLYTMAEIIARAWGAEVRADSLDHMNAFMVRMKHRAVIYLRKQLTSRQRAWGVCHELAHLALNHRSHSSFGLDPRRLLPEEIPPFERQEAEANALASLWLHLFEGLMDIGVDLGRSNRATARPSRKRPAPSRCGTPAGCQAHKVEQAPSTCCPPS